MNRVSSRVKTNWTLKKAKKWAWGYFSLYIRYKYRKENGMVECYTCGKEQRPEGDRMQAGHWYTGHGNVVYLNEIYVRIQCYSCNMGRGGMQGEFRDRIRAELGNRVVNKLLLEAKNTVKYTIEDYLKMGELYKSKLEKLQK